MELNFSISLWNYIHFFPLRKGGTNYAFENGLDGLAAVVAEVAAQSFGVEPWGKWTSWKWTSPAREGMVADEIDLFDPAHHQRLREIFGGVRSSWHTENEDTIEEYQRQIDTVACTESQVLVVHAGNLFLTGADPDYGFAREVLECARAKNVTIALENASDGETEDDPSLWNLSILRRALDKLPDLKICLDTTHTQKYNRFPLTEYIDALKDSLCHLHISDAFARATFEANSSSKLRTWPEAPFARMHTTPGRGIIPEDDWLYLLEALDEINFEGEAVLEIIPLSPLRSAEETQRFLAGLGQTTG